MADQREADMLEFMREATGILRRCENTINEIWAEWTRLHEPTIDRSGPKEKQVVRRQVVRREVIRNLSGGREGG
jgi:hypothetical protein